MNVLVKYIDFHSDNYQGGSGKSFELKTIMTLDATIQLISLRRVVMDRLVEQVKVQRPFNIAYDPKPTIVSMEIL